MSSARALAEGFTAGLGIELIDAPQDGPVRARLRCDERHLRAGGVVHGGVLFTLADSLAAAATIRLLGPDARFTTAEMKLNVFSPAKAGDELLATATAAHVGRRTLVWRVDVVRGGRPAALFVCTQMLLQDGTL